MNLKVKSIRRLKLVVSGGNEDVLHSKRSSHLQPKGLAMRWLPSAYSLCLQPGLGVARCQASRATLYGWFKALGRAGSWVAGQYVQVQSCSKVLGTDARLHAALAAL